MLLPVRALSIAVLGVPNFSLWVNQSESVPRYYISRHIFQLTALISTVLLCCILSLQHKLTLPHNLGEALSGRTLNCSVPWRKRDFTFLPISAEVHEKVTVLKRNQHAKEQGNKAEMQGDNLNHCNKRDKQRVQWKPKAKDYWHGLNLAHQI